MNDTPLSSTLRKMRSFFTDARVWTALVVLSLVIGLVGPFGTYFAMPVPTRLFYWTAIVIGTALTGTLVATFFETVFEGRLPALLAAVLAGALAGPAVALLVTGINVGAFGDDPTPPAFGALLAYCTLISAGVTLLGAIFGRRGAEAVPAAEPAPAPPALIERLPRPLRGRLLHIAVSDHYVDVTTDKGTTLILMRLSDAIRETAPVAGLQVHRSHWVALDAVRLGRRDRGKPILELETGALVPVSRTYLDAVRAAGLLR